MSKILLMENSDTYFIILDIQDISYLTNKDHRVLEPDLSVTITYFLIW